MDFDRDDPRLDDEEPDCVEPDLELLIDGVQCMSRLTVILPPLGPNTGACRSGNVSVGSDGGGRYRLFASIPLSSMYS